MRAVLPSLLLLCALTTACDSAGEDAGPRANAVRMTLNGEPVALDTVFAAPTEGGGASWSGEHCVEGRFPRNLALSFFLPDPAPGTYPVDASPSLGEPELLVVDSDGDAVTGWYVPSGEGEAAIVVEAFDPASGRLRGRFYGAFEVDPELSSEPEFRYFPDRLDVTDGVFDVVLAPEDPDAPVREGPCL